MIRVTGWTQTAADGSFALRLNPGHHDISFFKSGFAAKDIGGVEVTKSTPSLRVVLEPGIEIRGRVIRKGDGAALHEGMLYAVQQSQQGMSQGQIEADGSFTIGSLTPGTYMVQYQSEEGSASRIVQAPATDIVLELPAMLEVRGRVFDKASGAAVPEFTVYAATPTERHSPPAPFADPDGKFVKKLPAGQVHLTITAPGYVAEQRSVTVSAASASEVIEVALTRGRRVRGRVTSLDGKPVADASINVDAMSHAGATSDEAGEYELDGVSSSDPVEITVSKDGFLSASRTLPAGSEDQTLDVALDPGRKISGRVVDQHGKPVEGAWISASTEAHGATSQSAMSAADGSFTIAGLLPTRYSFSASKDGSGEAERNDVDIATIQSLLLTLGNSASGTIRGSIAGASSGTWMMAMVAARGENGSAQAQVGRDGRFVIENVPAGEVNVVGMLYSTQSQVSTRPAAVQLAAGGDVEVQLEIGGSGSLRGTVWANGQAAPGASVSLWGSDGDAQWRTTAGEHGLYQIEAIPPGRYHLSATEFGGKSYSTEIDIDGAATHDIRIEQITIAGRVVDEDSAPVAEAKVAAQAATKQRYRGSESAVTDSSGAFSLTIQADSEFMVTASARGFAGATVKTDGRTPLLMKLMRSEGARVRLVDSRDGTTLSGYVVVTDDKGVQIPVTTSVDPDGAIQIPLPPGSYRISASASQFASNTVRASVPSSGEIPIGLTPGGTLMITSSADANELIKLVKPSGEEYVRCYCNGIAEIRLTGASTKVDHVAGGSYRMDVIDGKGSVKRSYPVTIVEGQITSVDATR
jgi:protocatechuate 3,4-dioxygenase beta subunit